MYKSIVVYFPLIFHFQTQKHTGRGGSWLFLKWLVCVNAHIVSFAQFFVHTNIISVVLWVSQSLERLRGQFALELNR